MTHTPARPGLFVISAVFAALALAAPGWAAQRTPAPASGRPAAEQGRAESVPVGQLDEPGAEQTRRQLNELFERYPPSLARVLKLDPSLMDNTAYLAPYAGLSAFLGTHPEIKRNPEYFLEGVNVYEYEYWNTPERRRREEMLAVLAGCAVFVVFLVVTSVIVWVIRTIVATRRWNRISKIQFEVHNKLLDRFTSNEDLLAYVQTPPGRKFLEFTPIPLQEAARSISAPFSRILWSVQAGVVLAVAGGGLLYVSGRFIDEPAQFFMVVGVLALALGTGFIISAIAAYGLSRKLGLLDPPTADHA